MAVTSVTEELSKVVVNINLANGTDSQGRTKTVAVSLGTLSSEGYDNKKAAEIATKLVACLALPLDSLNNVKTNELIVS